MKSTLLALVILLAAPALADEARDLELARGLYKTATVLYNLGEYEQALGDFRTAYRRHSDPAFLFNVAQCLRQLGRYDAAAKSFRAYLRESSDLSDDRRAEVQRLVNDMDTAAAAQLARLPPTGTQAPSLPAPAAAPVEPQPPRAWYRNGWAWSATASGVALVVAGGALLGYAATLDGANAATLADRQRQLDEVARYQPTGYALVGIGSGLTIAGAIVFTLAARASKHGGHINGGN